MRIGARAPAIAIGTLAGAAIAALALALLPSRHDGAPWNLPRVAGHLVDEAAGPIDEIAFHYVPEAEPIYAQIYRAFLPSLDSSTRLRALVPPSSEGDPAEGLRHFLRALPEGEALLARTRIAVASGPISPWSKDRALVANASGMPIELFAPAEAVADTERRRADWKSPMDLARASAGALAATVLPLDFDAGDFAITGDRLLVDANLVGKNAGRGLDSPAKLRALLHQLFGLEVIVLGDQPGDVPRHHLSMYLTPLTAGAVLLGDPREGRRLVGERFAPGEASPDSGAPLVADFSEETLARYDRAAADLAKAGFAIVRIPTVPFDDKTYFAYTNGVFETRAGKRVAWVPTFNEPRLDEPALAVYRAQGWEPRPVPSRAAFPFHGTLGCLVNVLARHAP